MLTVAPHILGIEIESPGRLQRLSNGWIDVDAWLTQQGMAEPLSEPDLAEALDGGKPEYNNVCREDVLRILLNLYDGEGPSAEMTAQEACASPLKRRYYSVQTVGQALAALGPQGKVRRAGRRYTQQDLDLLSQGKPPLTENMRRWRINPRMRDEIKGIVEEVEQAALSANALVSEDFDPTSCRSTLQVIGSGQVHDGWEALRAILAVATTRVDIEDAHIDADVVALMRSVPDGVAVRVLSRKLFDDADPAFRRLAKQRLGTLEVRTTANLHGRRIYVDERIYILEDPIKDLASKTASSIMPVDMPTETQRLTEDFERRWATAGVRIRPKA